MKRPTGRSGPSFPWTCGRRWLDYPEDGARIGPRTFMFHRTHNAYIDRRDAGATLAPVVRAQLGTRDNVLVLALPRGGVPVAGEIARELGAELDVFVVRKLGVPGHAEYAMGAIAPRGFQVLNREAIAALRISAADVAAVAATEAEELQRREALYRGELPPPRIAGRIVLLVDDGLATGFTMRAAIAAIRAENPAQLVVAVPVGARATCDELAREVDALICPLQPEDFSAVGEWYEDFSATSDDEVQACLAQARAARRHSPEDSP